MIYGAPEGTVGAANPSGWSNEATFVMFMEHFIKFTRPSKERPVIVLMDNHESHISVPAIRLAKENGVILVTLHPHTSNKIQPLDKSVFGPFKTYFNQAANEKLMTPGHIGKPLTIYDIAELVGKAFPPAFTPMNIANGFKATGFHPLNENIFSDVDFLAANFSDCPLPQEISTQPDYVFYLKNHLHRLTHCFKNLQSKLTIFCPKNLVHRLVISRLKNWPKSPSINPKNPYSIFLKHLRNLNHVFQNLSPLK